MKANVGMEAVAAIFGNEAAVKLYSAPKPTEKPASKLPADYRGAVVDKWNVLPLED